MPTSTGMPAFLTAWDEINALIQGRQREANAARIPGAAALEDASSRAIMELLNPTGRFADTDRQSAELGAIRGIAGSAAGETAGYRMTDEEKLKRLALGQQFLTAADARNPIAPIDVSDVLGTYITPSQQAQNRLQQEDLRRQRDQFNLLRSQQAYLGRPTTASGNVAPQRINIAGSGYAPQWIDWIPGM